MIRRRLLALLAASAVAGAAHAQRMALCDAAYATSCAGMRPTLISGANAATTGPTIQHIYKDSYFYTCVASAWNGASAQLQFLGPDGSTWMNFTGAALTANGVIGVGIGANSTVRATVTGTPTALYCNLS